MGLFEIHRGANARDGESRVAALQKALESTQIRHAGKAPRTRASAVALSADFQLVRFALSHALHGETQRFIFDLRLKHATHYIALGRPHVKHAFIVLA
jgi:hypothetical protein